MTPKQLGILRHALGLRTDGSGRPYRNHFVTGPGSDDYDDCKALVEQGLMIKLPGDNGLDGGNDCFRVTEAGREAAKSERIAPIIPPTEIHKLGTDMQTVEESSADNFEPCPFCGCFPRIYKWNNSSGGKYIRVCCININCCIKPGFTDVGIGLDVIQIWNRRVGAAPTPTKD
jgi:hypothetical protein